MLVEIPNELISRLIAVTREHNKSIAQLVVMCVEAEVSGLEGTLHTGVKDE